MTAKEYWKDQFDELPKNDAEKLAVVMMQRYAFIREQQAWDAGLSEASQRIKASIVRVKRDEQSINDWRNEK